MDALTLALGLSLGFNVAMFIPAYMLKTDKLTDISYALTFMLVSLVVFLQSEQTAGHLIALALVWLWAIRLGGFLLYRVRTVGKDQRFDHMRDSLLKFGRFWVLQGLSVFVILLAGIVYWRQPYANLSPMSLIGLLVFAEGLGLESLADQQKFAFKRAGKSGWIETGVWGISRHPNYLGEIMVWSGMFLFVSPNLLPADKLIALISPVYIGLLLCFVSGIPILEKAADKRWGRNPDYRAYKKRVPVLLPKIKD